MSAPAVLIATAKVRPGEEDAFAAWQVYHNAAVAKFPGFVSSDILPPGAAGSNEWTIVLNFQTPDQLTVWQKSAERAALLAEALPFFEGGNLGEAMNVGGAGEAPGTTVTEVILSKIKPGMDDVYREWAVRIQQAQSKYPGYRGMYLQPPTTGKDGHWTTLVRYDTAEHLEGWMAAPERAELLRESKAFIESEELMRLATSFPGWVPVDPVTGKGPPDWKTALLVLLGLFPTVMLEMRFLSPVLAGLGLHASLATFIGNAGSVAITSFITMPLCVRWFGWWLFPADDAEKATVTARGVAILVGLFTIEIAVLWRLLPG
ncbi:MAG: antibiotic biosynthesis monooxygenase [Terrimicrobiaceae bacterium]|nr:antibiotic biosynthesis monooxygenase [Terrimicrobiaceae bacterium]